MRASSPWRWWGWLALSVLALNRILADINYDDLVVAIQDTSWLNIGLALLFTVLSFAALSIYDRQALALVAHKVPFSYVALTSFCAYAVGNIAGFGPLTGGTVRYRFYSPLGVSPEDVARIVGYVTAAFGFGLLFVTGLGLLMADAKLAALVGLPAIAVRVTAIVILAFVGAVFIAAAVGPPQVTVFGHRVAIPGPGALALQLAATMSDLIASALVLWVLLPAGAIDFPSMLSIYAVAIGLGILSHVPGGAGVFETVILGALGTRLPLDGLVGALLLYRVIYYVIPLALGGDRTHGHGAQARSGGERCARPGDGSAGAARSFGLCRDAWGDAHLLGRDARLRPEAGLAAIRVSASGRRGRSFHRQHSRPAHDPHRPRTRASAGRRVVVDGRACGELDRARLRQGL